MPGKFRLTRADLKVFSSKSARRVRGAFFTLSVAPLASGTLPKAACVVSKKVARKATDRNRIKRRCREILRPLIPHIKQPLAIVFYANTASAKAAFEQLSEDIKNLLKKNNQNF